MYHVCKTISSLMANTVNTQCCQIVGCIHVKRICKWKHYWNIATTYNIPPILKCSMLDAWYTVRICYWILIVNNACDIPLKCNWVLVLTFCECHEIGFMLHIFDFRSFFAFHRYSCQSQHDDWFTEWNSIVFLKRFVFFFSFSSLSSFIVALVSNFRDVFVFRVSIVWYIVQQRLWWHSVR